MQADLGELERRPWDAADELRANSALKSSEYGTPVLGLIFLRFADAKFKAARGRIEATASARRTVGPSDDHAERVIYVTDAARFDSLLALPEGTDLGTALNDAMRAVEEQNFRAASTRTSPGLCKVATTTEIEAQGWSLNPGRYVGTEVEDFDDEVFEEKLAAAHIELRELAARAASLEASVDQVLAQRARSLTVMPGITVGRLSLTICAVCVRDIR